MPHRNILLVEIEEFAVMFFTGTFIPVLEAMILRILIHLHFEKAKSLSSLIKSLKVLL